MCNVTLVKSKCKQVRDIVNGTFVATITLSDNTVWELVDDKCVDIDFEDFSYIDDEGDTQAEVYDMLKVWNWKQL